MSNPTIKIDFNTIRIYFGPVLHLCINRVNLIGVQSWICDDYRHTIEYNFPGCSIITEYDKRETFEHILAALDGIL